jgi:hypothetical protein
VTLAAIKLLMVAGVVNKGIFDVLSSSSRST